MYRIPEVLEKVEPRERRHRFGRHDRLVIDGQSFRVDRKIKDTHFLQPVTDGLVVEDYYLPKTDREINALWRTGRLRHEEGHYTKVLSLLRVRHDNSDLSDLSETALRTVAWKKEWCVRFLRAAGDPDAEWRPKNTLDDMAAFVEDEKDRMDHWYLGRFGERRPPGRNRKGEVRKAFDYPSPSALRNWLARYVAAGCRMEAFRPGYGNCGNRNQIDPRALPVIKAAVQKYASRLKPKMADICEDVELALESLNASLPPEERIYASDRAVRRRIHEIDPFIKDAGRDGLDFALRKYTPVGKGLQVTGPFARIEMDDWEADLHTLASQSKLWKTLSAQQKAKVPRVRCTVTIGIDCATRSIAGLNMTPHSPSAATAKSALRSVMVDKTPLARWAGANAAWDIFSRPGFVATDGGPVFRGEFEEALRLCRTNRTLPDQDPRMRGTVESFFRTLKRLCRYFAGQAFKDVLEKGDYPAEQMASLTFEAFYKAVVRFIVDKYHHTKHRGLEGGTPYGTWLRLSNCDLPPPLPEQQLKAAFGFRRYGTVSKHGIEYEGLAYQSDQLGQLHRYVGNQQVEMTVDADDLEGILVRIPRKHKGRIDGVPHDHDYLEVGCVDGTGAGVTLVQLLEAKTEVKELARQQQEAGKAFRLAAHADLLDISERERKAANLPSHELTQKQHDLVMHAIAQKQRAALSSVEYGPAGTAKGAGRPGEVVAQSRRTRPAPTGAAAEPDVPAAKPAGQQPEPSKQRPKPFGGGMNLFGEDE